MKVPADIIRLYKSLHTWVGISSGLLLFIGFFAGAVTMFKQPIDGWAQPAQQRLPLVAEAQRDVLIQAVLSQYPSAQTDFTLFLTDDDHVPASLVWYENTQDGHELALNVPQSRATLDGENKLVVSQPLPSKLSELIDMLHRTGGIPGEIGHEYIGIYLMGVAGLLYGLALVSGVIILLPSLVKDFFALRQGPNRKRFWLDAHNIIGITSLPFHLVIALTVVVFAFHDQFYGSLQSWVYGDHPMFQRTAAGTEIYPPEQLLPVAELLQRIDQAAPEFTVTRLEFWRLDSPRAVVRASLSSDDYLTRGANSGFVLLNPYTGTILDTNALPGQQDFWSSVVATFFALHFGSYGGDGVRWIYFVMGLGGAFLFYTGNLLWVASRQRKQTTSASVRYLASATVGVCLGCVAGIAVAMSGAKWLILLTDHVNNGVVWLYYPVFLLCCGWALLRPAAQGAAELMLLTALCILAIPFTSLLALLMPATGLWVNTRLSSLLVDLTALLMGLLALVAAHKLFGRISHRVPVETTDTSKALSCQPPQQQKTGGHG